MLRLLTSLLEVEWTGKEPRQDIHLERLYLFSLMWTVAADLAGSAGDENSEKQRFSDMLRSLTDALPDDDKEICLFDYFVDEMGEWDLWQSRLSEFIFNDTFHSVLNNCSQANSSTRTSINSINFSPSGKTDWFSSSFVLFNQTIHQNHVNKISIGESLPTADYVDFFKSKLRQRYGLVHGAPNGKRFFLFLDDLSTGSSSLLETTRQLIDGNFVYHRETNPTEWHTVEDFVVSASRHFLPLFLDDICIRQDWLKLSQNLFRMHCSQLFLTEITNLFNSIAGIDRDGSDKEASVTPSIRVQDLSLRVFDAALVKCINEINARVMTALDQVCKPISLPGRNHYHFNARTLESIIENLIEFAKLRLNENKEFESQGNEQLFQFWASEIERFVKDTFARNSDCIWFEELLENLRAEILSSICPSIKFPPREQLNLINPIDEEGIDIETKLNNWVSTDWPKLAEITVLDSRSINLVLKVYRVLQQKTLHNVVVVGQHGTGLKTLLLLAMRLAQVPIFSTSCLYEFNKFCDDMRALVRKLALGDQRLGLLFDGDDLCEGPALQVLNSLLMNGEEQMLYKNENMDGLVEAIRDQMRDLYGLSTNASSLGLDAGLVSSMIDPVAESQQVEKRIQSASRPSKQWRLHETRFLASRVLNNLRVCVALTTDHPFVRNAASLPSGLHRRMQWIWIRDCEEESLFSTASYFVKKLNLPLCTLPEANYNELVTCLCKMHITAYEVISCGPPEWFGQMTPQVEQWIPKQQMQAIMGNTGLVNEESKISSNREHSGLGTNTFSKKLNAILTTTNLPTARMLLCEQVRNERQQFFEKTNPSAAKYANENFFSDGLLTQIHFKRMLSLFVNIYTSKKDSTRNKIAKIRAAVSTLQQLREDVEKWKGSLPELKVECRKSCAEAETIYKELLEAVGYSFLHILNFLYIDHRKSMA
ncbi:hypothetical protein Ciccas_000410 [Cichlidogyrus casuarinus]|uniref:Uncharacterized protein n=1 Tax=Cichlidogyrus casuarinus TaxID=1844966 RepID=A0ABD2QN15_9PLAT